MSAQPESEVTTPSCNATLQPESGPNVQRDTPTPVSRARDYTAKVVPLRGAVRPFAERAAQVKERESDHPLAAGRLQPRSPWSEDRPSPRCRIADARRGAETFGAIYWLFDAIPLLISLAVAKPLDLLTERPGQFWGLVTLITAFSLFIALH